MEFQPALIRSQCPTFCLFAHLSASFRAKRSLESIEQASLRVKKSGRSLFQPS
jgi:hypothetical protein